MSSSNPDEWKPVVGFEGIYEVSRRGQVISLDRRVFCPKPGMGRPPSWRNVRGRVLKPWTTADGYLAVELCKHGRRSTMFVHNLVMRAFVGPKPHGLVTRHLNGVPSDNRRENLAYGTQSENNLDKIRHGTDLNVLKTHCPKNHPYSPENTYTHGTSRHCRECMRIANRRLRAQRKEQVA